MPQYTIIKLKNMSPLHMGNGKENYDFSASQLQSDTISAALAAIKIQKDGETDIKEFMNSFHISSAFPYWNDSYFMPKPQGKISVKVKNEEEHLYRKSLKKIKYIELPIWQQLIQGKSIEVEHCQLKGEYLTTPQTCNMDYVSCSQVMQRVTVPRDGSDNAKPFFFEWNFYQPNAGLYCIIDASDKMLKKITDLFQYLGEIGIGTDKNVGGGKFEVETSHITITPPETYNSIMLLSLYIPSEEEIKELNLQQAKYEIIRRGGYMAGSQIDDFRHLLKKSIYMFNTGSVFPCTNQIEGKIVNLQPDWNDADMHPVYRSGRPMYIPIKQE